jgi:hypothetical protein
MALHHVADVPGALRRLHAALRSGGRVALADLDPDGGTFHDQPGLARHDGFEREALLADLAAAGFVDLEADTATTVSKDGRDYTIFLITGRRAP